jgi:hypothetical protein
MNIPCCRKTFYDDIVFFKHDRQMTEGVGGWPLKPDCLGCRGPPPSDRNSVSWGEVEFVIEVKNTWAALIMQGATYARAILAYRSSRRFAVVICFNHNDGCARICLYHRAGMYSTEALKLTDKSGFKTFVSAIVGLLSWSNKYEAGMDMSRNNNAFYIPSFGIYNIVNTFCNRQVVRGRATRVYSVERSPTDGQARIAEGTEVEGTEVEGTEVKDEDDVTKNKTISLPPSQPRNHYHLRDRSHGAARPRAAGLRTILQTTTMTVVLHNHDHDQHPGDAYQQGILPPEPSEEAIRDDRCILTGKRCQDRFILKDSWPLAGRSCEAEMFADVKGEFGVPVLLGSYLVNEGQLMADGSVPNVMELPNDATYWDIFQTPEASPEIRYHVRSMFETEGDHLVSSSGPKELVRALCHALLGKCLSAFPFSVPF